MEEVDFLLHPDGGVPPVHAVPVLLDGGHRGAPDPELYRTWRQANATPFWTLEPTLEHFRGLMQTTAFPHWLWNTMLIALVSTAISLVCGMFAGYALARLKFRGSEFLGTAIFVTYLVPQTLLFIPLADIIRDMHLGNTPVGADAHLSRRS